MRKIIYAVSIVAILFVSLDSCKPKNESQQTQAQDNPVIDNAHNSKNSLEWYGSYTGVIPCADCPGINIQITLNEDETYQLSYQYIDSKSTPESFSGKFTWDETGNTITLDIKDIPPYYKVGENKLIQLDMEGNPITGELADNYILTKN